MHINGTKMIKKFELIKINPNFKILQILIFCHTSNTTLQFVFSKFMPHNDIMTLIKMPKLSNFNESNQT